MRLLGFKMPARVASRSGTSTKGRGGRKGGASRSSSGPERRRVLRPQNYKQTPAIKAWREPVPQPLPPAPLLGLPTLALLGVQALAQIWGLFNSKQPPNPDIPPGYEPPTNTKYTEGIVTRPPGGSGGFTIQWTSSNVNPGNFGLVTPSNVYLLRIEREYIEGTALHDLGGTTYTVFGYTLTGELAYGQCFQQGIATGCLRFDGPGDSPISFDTVIFTSIGSNNETLNHDLVPVVVEPLPERVEILPVVNPSSGLPAPIKTPHFEPPPNIQTAPGVLPSVVPTSPGPVAPAVVKPALPPTVAPITVPTTTPTKDGTLVAPAPAPVPVTPQDAIFPVPGGTPVSGQTVRRTIQGIAQEVGRIEQKIDKMVNPTPGQWGDKKDVNRILEELARRILDAILSLRDGTTYTLDSPCEVNEASGEKLPAVEIEVDGGLSVFGTILNRIDAIAELIQVHKDLKQPNCKPKQPVGEFVTVNFEEID